MEPIGKYPADRAIACELYRRIPYSVEPIALFAVVDGLLIDRLDRRKSIHYGGILYIHYKPGSFLWNELMKFRIVDSDKKIQDYTPKELDLLLYSEPFLIKGSKEAVSYHRNFEGLVRKLKRSMAEKGKDEAEEEDKNAYLRFFRCETCPHCKGSRISDAARDVKLSGVSIDEVCRLEIPQVLAFLKSINDEAAIPITRRAIFIVEQLIHIGVGYMNLERPVGTLSGGQSQRLKIAAQLQKESNIFIMDEPTTGPHRSDIGTFYRIIKKLVERNNTVIIIEHNTDIIKRADWIIDSGSRERPELRPGIGRRKAGPDEGKPTECHRELPLIPVMQHGGVFFLVARRVRLRAAATVLSAFISGPQGRVMTGLPLEAARGLKGAGRRIAAAITCAGGGRNARRQQLYGSYPTGRQRDSYKHYILDNWIYIEYTCDKWI